MLLLTSQAQIGKRAVT